MALKPTAKSTVRLSKPFVKNRNRLPESGSFITIAPVSIDKANSNRTSDSLARATTASPFFTAYTIAIIKLSLDNGEHYSSQVMVLGEINDFLQGVY